MRRLPALLLFPALVVAVALWLSDARGPFWLGGNLDPAYLYLLNGLSVARLQPPAYFDHPGTPVIVAAGVIIRATHLVAGEAPLVLDVLTRPETYLGAIHAVLLATCALVLLAVGAVIVRLTGSIALALVVQSTPLLSLNALEGLTRVSPEPLLVSLSIAFVVLAIVHAERGAASDDGRFATTAGLVAGLLIATKLTALPLVIVPLAFFVAPLRPKLVARFAAFASLAFVIGTLPILPKYASLFRWVIKIATHTGMYGEGPVGLVNLPRYVANLKRSISIEWPAVAILAAASLVAWLVSRRQRETAHPGRRRLLVALLILIAAQFLLSSKQAMPRYLVPALGALGGVAVVSIACLGESLVRKRRAIAAALLLVTAAAIPRTLAIIRYHDNRAAESRNRLSLAREVETRYAGRRIMYGYGASSYPYAHFFGNVYAGSAYRRELAARFPDALFFDPFKGGFYSFSGPVPARDLPGLGAIVYQSPPLEGSGGWRLATPKNASFQPLFRTPVEALHEARFHEAE